MRHLINQAFTRSAITSLADDISQLTQTLLDKVRPQGKMDFVTDFALPLTTNLVALLLGVPVEDWHLFGRWTKGEDETLVPHTREETIAFHNLVGQEIYDYFSLMLAERRREPRADLITALSAAELNGERLSDDEILKFCVLLLVAGQETVQNLLTHSIYCLTQFTESRDQLIQQPELIPSAIEEVLRYLPPFWISVRRTTCATELGGSVSLPTRL
ncbi:cytochrome P450 [Dictyobacter kobayashii]|uniref:Cytochrome P450 n=1 Tax=Dictyobacter kobayashii TaxID=2014872 RepID=A0A402ARD3_9CHLR|nr:cytochrome P450 [Dictyobacter kobayashii]GCE21647.1 hypothetical protein KDK_54470 [Dictyobacter kobayashii]